MSDQPDKKERWAWWKAHELRINISATILFVTLTLLGIALGIGVLAGLSFLLVIFFGTYTVYAYIRRYW